MKKILFVVILLISSAFYAQQNLIKDYNSLDKKYSISNPDVYAFEKYELNPVNHFNGKANVSIPIYTIKTGGLEYPIVLNYDTGGIKVDQLASNVGLGWSLSRTMITRTIQGYNDFDNTGSTYNGEELDANLPDIEGQMDVSAWGSNGHTGKNGYFIQKEFGIKIEENNKIVDFLPDIYNFYSHNFNTKFFFEDIDLPVELDPKGTQIEAIVDYQKKATRRGHIAPFSGQWEYVHDLYTKDFFNINVISNSGVEYKFNDCDFAYNENYRTSLNENGIYFAKENLGVNSPAQISAWHISEILDRKNGKKISFVYETTHSNPNPIEGSPTGFDFKAAQLSYIYNTIPINPDLTGCHYYAPWADYPYSGNKFLLTASARIDVERKILKKIEFDEGSVEFNYNHEGIGGPGVSRTDVANGNFITQIYVKDKDGNTVKTFNLDYGAFQSDYNVGEFDPFNEYSTYRYTRLKLESVQEAGLPPYELTYDESIKLPPINSFAVDFTGYFNNSNDVVDNLELIDLNRHPQMYYYPNQYEKSLLPFPLSGTEYTTIPGYFNRQANDFSKAWSLTKIKYPTGGFTEIEYESNSFKVFGEEKQGGGIRVKKQSLKNEDGSVAKSLNYEYKGLDGLTSGTLFSFPFFGHPLNEFFVAEQYYDYDENIDPIFAPSNPTPPGHPYNTVHWKLFDKSNLLEDITSGSFVGYSRVIEKEIGNGSRELNFTSNNEAGYENEIIRYDAGRDYVSNDELPSFNRCMTEFLITNSSIKSNIFTDNSYKRGKIKSEYFFNNSNELLKEINYNYVETLHNTYTHKQTFTKQVHTVGESTARFMTSKKDYKVASFRLDSKEERTYLEGQEYNNTNLYSYNDLGLISSTSYFNSDGNEKRVDYLYSGDSEVASEPFITDLVGQNRLSELVKEEVYDNSDLISTKQLNYDLYQGSVVYYIIVGFETVPWVVDYDFVLPVSLSTSKGDSGVFEEEFFIDQFDIKGNITQYHNKEGKTTSLIWGYNQTKIIAKIENATYAEVEPYVASIQSASNAGNSETYLISALDDLRVNLPNAMITSYTHIPLVGVSTITDYKKNTTTFHYDSSGRLQFIKDEEGNILSENEYNYKN